MFCKAGYLEKYNILLGTPPKIQQKEELYLFWILRITAVKEIARGYKKSEPPKVRKWVETVEDI